MSITNTTTTEELYEQYLNGKSIEQISKETGKTKWALYKAFQRLKCCQERQDNEGSHISEERENVDIDSQKAKSVKQFFQALGVIATMLAISVFPRIASAPIDAPIDN